MEHLKANNVQNVIAITDDLHAFQCGIVRDTPDPVTGTPVLLDLVSAGISSSSFFSYVKAGAAGTPLSAIVVDQPTFEAVIGGNKPDLLYHDHHAQGYATAIVTAAQMVVTISKVRPLIADGATPESPLLKRTRVTIGAGSLAPVIEDNVRRPLKALPPSTHKQA
jgi:alkaline phosphatase D